MHLALDILGEQPGRPEGGEMLFVTHKAGKLKQWPVIAVGIKLLTKSKQEYFLPKS